MLDQTFEDDNPNICWCMLYFGPDYEVPSTTLYFRDMEEAIKFSRRVNPYLRSSGWFTEGVTNKEELLQKTQVFLEQVYKAIDV